MTIRDLEETYQQLHEELLRGQLGEEEFKSEVERLRFEDDEGDQWKIGWYTGQWYRYEEGEWVQGKPRERKTEPAPAAGARSASDDGRTKKAATSWLVPVLVSLLLLAIVVLVVGWSVDWWGGPTEGAISVAESATATETSPPPSETPHPTDTSRPSPTSAPTSSPTVTRTPRPTTTRTAPAASPTETATQTPSPTPQYTPTPIASSPTSSSGQLATPSSLSGRIFFPVFDPSPDHQTFDIHSIQLESGEREIVVGQASQPALSPDGKRMAYRSWDNARRGILVRELVDGHTWVWIKFGEAARPSWSPDSQNIVFPSQQESDREWRIYRTFGLEFDRVRRHGGDILGRVPVWLADGRIVYWECPLNKCGLYVMREDGTNPTQFTTGEHDTAPSASPDGSRVAFASNRDGNWEIYVVSTEVAGGQREQGLRRLTRNAARDGLPTWSPDGNWLAFATDRDGAWAVWAIRPDGSGLQKLFDLDGPLEGRISSIPSGDQHGWAWETIAWGP